MKNLLIHTVIFWLFLLVFAATFSSCDKADDQPPKPITDAAGLTDALPRIQEAISSFLGKP